MMTVKYMIHLLYFIKPMEDIIEIIRYSNPEVSQQVEEAITYLLLESEDGDIQEHIMGINIRKSKLFSEIGLYEQDLYISISISSGNTENVANAIIALFE